MGQPSVIRVLVVARRDPQEPIGASLKRAGYGVLWAASSLAATRALEHHHPDALVIHKPTLARGDLESLTAVAAEHDIPVLVLSRPTAPGAGASANPVAERVEALLAEARSGHASAGNSETERLTVGSLLVDLDEHAAWLHGVPLGLTATEFELLCHFARRPGRVWSRQQLIDLVWSHDYVDPHVVTVHIANLRKKLEQTSARAAAAVGPVPSAAAVSIEALRGVGYRLVGPTDRPAGRPLERAAERPPVGRGEFVSGRLPFVGREREREVLRGVVDEAMNGQLRGAAVVGDPGIGKTRLAEEAAGYARDEGARLYWGKCRDAVVKPVYEPWVEIMEQWKREEPAGEFDQVFVPEPPGDLRAPVDGESARLRLFDRLADAVRRRAEASPLCLIIDDLHWADPSTLAALQYVTGHLGGARLMLILTYRPGEGAAQSPLLTQVVADLVRNDLGVILPLGPLSEIEVGQFVELIGLERLGSTTATISGAAPTPQPIAGVAAESATRLTAEIYRKTEGDPFFMTQLVRLHLLGGEVSMSQPHGRTLSREEGVRRVVLSRLSPLSPPCREALDVASVIGREFAQPVLADAMDLAPGPLMERLAEAVDTNVLFIREDAPEEYRFVHSIFQDVLSDELAPHRRATLHAKVGMVLEQLHGDRLDAYAADLAHHFSEAVSAGFAPQAVEHCLRAGRVAFAHYAWDEACAQLRRAVDLIELLPADTPQKDPAFAARVWEELGYDYWVLLDTDRALEAYEQAALRVPPKDRLWRASLTDKAAYMHILCHRFEQAAAPLAEAETLLGAPAESADESWWDTWISVQRHRGAVHFYEARFEELYTLLDRVERTAGTHGGTRERGMFQHLQIFAEWSRQRWVSTGRILDLAEECAKNLRAAGSPEDLLWAETTLADALLWSPERWGEAHGQIVLVLDLSRRYCSAYGVLGALWDLEVWHRRRREVDAVRRYALETLSLITESPGIWTEYGGEAKGHLSWVAWREGDLDRARTLSAESLEEIRGDVFSAYEWQARWTLLGLGLLDEDWDEASQQAEAMLEPLQQKMPDDLEQLLQELVDEHAQGRPPSPETIEALTTTARAYGYL